MEVKEHKSNIEKEEVLVSYINKKRWNGIIKIIVILSITIGVLILNNFILGNSKYHDIANSLLVTWIVVNIYYFVEYEWKWYKKLKKINLDEKI